MYLYSLYSLHLLFFLDNSICLQQILWNVWKQNKLEMEFTWLIVIFKSETGSVPCAFKMED